MNNIEPYLQNKIFEKSNNKINIKEAINEFIYIGKFNENDKIFQQIKQKLNINKYRCLCNRGIKNICIYANKYNNNLIILGSDCMKKFLNKYINKKNYKSIQQIINLELSLTKEKIPLNIDNIINNYDNIIEELKQYMIICNECEGIFPLDNKKMIDLKNNNNICFLCIDKIIDKLYNKRLDYCGGCGYSCCRNCFYFYNFVELRKKIKKTEIPADIKNGNYYYNTDLDRYIKLKQKTYSFI